VFLNYNRKNIIHRLSYFWARTGPDFMHPTYTRGFIRCILKVNPSVAEIGKGTISTMRKIMVDNEVSIIKCCQTKSKIIISQVNFMPFTFLSICIKVHPIKQTLQIQLWEHITITRMFYRECASSQSITLQKAKKKYKSSIYQNGVRSDLLQIIYTSLNFLMYRIKEATDG